MSKILLVDDSKVIRQGLSLAIQSFGLEVHTAECGAEGIKILDREKFNLIISDFHMPDMSGLVMADIITSRYDIPIIMLTTEECTSELRNKAKMIGVKGWMVKPMKNDILKQTIDKVMKAHSRP
ncbi:MAG: response regulator [Oligoflexales bacterium]